MPSNLSPDAIDKIRNSPAGSPPPGIVPNYDNPPNGNRLAVAVIILGLVITTLAALIRFSTRAFYIRKVKLEDCLLTLPAKFSLGVN
jgi:hypothetical protein